MTASSDERESGGASPRVCVCGYDLSGLPDGPEAKCPECGAVIGEPPPPKSSVPFLVGVSAFALSPVIFMSVLAWSPLGRPADEQKLALGMLIALAILVWFVIAAVPASVVFAAYVLRSKRKLVRVVVVVAAPFICALLNMVILYIEGFVFALIG